MSASNLRRVARANAGRYRRRDQGLDFNSYRHVFDFLIAGDRRRIFKALDRGFDVNTPDRWGFLILHRACVCHLHDVVDALISRGSSLEAEATAGWRPLHMAALSNAYGCPTQLVRAGALIDIGDSDGNTPLHLAAHQRSTTMVRELLALGFDAKATNARHQTPGDRARASDYIWYEDQMPELTALLG